MEYIFDITKDKAALKKFVKIERKKNHSIHHLIVPSIAILFDIYYIYQFAWVIPLLRYGRMDFGEILPLLIIIIVYNVFAFSYYRFATAISYKRMYNGCFLATVNDNGIDDEYALGKEHLDFSLCQFLCRKDDDCYFFIDKRRAIFFSKSGMRSGDFDEFCNYLSEKTGKELIVY